jgi:basic membrane lipoprotein Med (substrate-binding protein (PBP1-ABC) superfamily)
MRRAAAAALAAVALLAPACGGWASDVDPPPPEPAPAVRVAAVGTAAADAAVRRGVRDAARLLGARRASAAAADLVVTADPGRAVALGRARSRAAVALLGAPAPAGAPPNVLGVVVRRDELAYLAGALAALVARPDGTVAVVGGPGVAEPFRRGAAAAAGGVHVRAAGCAAAATAAVVYAPGDGCRPSGWVIAERRRPGARTLAVVAPRTAVTVFRLVRAVQDGTFAGGTARVGLAEDALGVRWVDPGVDAATVDAFQRIADRVRAEPADA